MLIAWAKCHLFPTAMIFRGSGLIFDIGKKRREQHQLCSGTAAAVVAATWYFVATLATVQQGATVASHIELCVVVGTQPYDNKQLCSKGARMI